MVTVHSTIGALQRRVPQTSVSPIYIRLILLITGIVSIGSVGLTLLVRLNKPIPNPFTSYADIFPGQPQNAVLARGFSCQSSPQYCTSTPANSPFALIAVTLTNGVVKNLDF